MYSELALIEEKKGSFTGDFVFYNSSSELILVELKVTSCGCLSLQYEGRPLHVGDSFSILPGKTESVSMEMQYPRFPGKNEYKANFTTKYQGKDHIVEINMACPVFEDISIDPRIVQLNFDRSSVTSRNFSVLLVRTSREKSDLLGKPYLHNAPDFLALTKSSVRSYETEFEKGLWQKEWLLEFDVKFPAEKEMPKVPQSVSLAFDGVSSHSVDFTLILSKTYGVIFPRTITFPDTRLSESRMRSISIQSAAKQPFAVKSASSDHSSFSIITPVPSNELKQHWIEVEFVPKTLGENRGTLTLVTSHADSEEIEIDVEGIAFSE